MRGLSEHGKGLYFFIDSGESVVPLVNKAFDAVVSITYIVTLYANLFVFVVEIGW